MRHLTRRSWLHTTASFSLASLFRPARGANAAFSPPLGMSTYAMPGFSLEQAVQIIAETGFDSIEIAAMPGYSGAPDQLDTTRRRETRQRIADADLTLGALMGLPFPDAAKQVENSDWVQRLLELARDLSPARPPLIQSVLGGGKWEDKKNLFRDCLGPWVDAAREAGVRLAIKPHRFQAMNLPGHALWLIEQLNAADTLGLVFDASHFVFRNLDLESLAAQSLPHTCYLVLKDAIQREDEVRFELPGAAATIPHADLLRQFLAGGYRGELCAEVSSHLSKADNYDPVSASRACHTQLRRIAAQAQETGFKPIFNGRDLNGWDSKPGCWEVRDGEIWCTGQAKDKNWLIWRGGQPADFTLRLEFRWDKGNSGVQVRSDDHGGWQVFGAQVEVAERAKMGLWHHSLLDVSHPKKADRQHLATAGQEVHIARDSSKTVRQLEDPAAIQAHYEEHAWNTLEVIARGPKLVQKINGVVFATLRDEDPEMSRPKGWIAFQDHGKGCQAAFRHIRLRLDD